MPFFFTPNEPSKLHQTNPTVRRNKELQDIFKRSEGELMAMFKQQARIQSPASQMYRMRMAEAIGAELQHRIEDDMPDIKGRSETSAQKLKRQGRPLSKQETANLKRMGVNQRAQNGIDIMCKSAEYRRTQESLRLQAPRKQIRPAEVWRELERPRYTVAEDVLRRNLQEQARVNRLPVTYTVTKEDIVPELALADDLQRERQLRVLENTLTESEIRQRHFERLSQMEQRKILEATWNQKAEEAMAILQTGRVPRGPQRQ